VRTKIARFACACQKVDVYMTDSDKKWILKASAPESFRMQFREYPDPVLHLAWQRGLVTQEALDEFFHPDYGSDLHDPFLYKDMDKACQRVKKALESGERIVVFGDYDADGTCGTVILTTLLRDLGGDVVSYLPDRFEEGHGLTEISIKEIKRLKASLVITVDCGITENWEIDELNKSKIDTIVLDHHLPQDILPEAYAVIDAKRQDDTYPFKWLCGTAVAFKFVQAMMKLSLWNQLSTSLPSGYEKRFLDLVAIATIADSVPLMGENRTMLIFGLPMIARTARLGLRSLLLRAGLSGEDDIDAEAVAFSIAPRINAASRLDHANIAFALLTTTNEEEAQHLAADLEDKNLERQKLVATIVKEAQEQIAAKDEIPSAIILCDKTWSLGVIGIVANKLLDQWRRPIFLFNEKNGLVRGSARAPEGFNLVEAMRSCGQDLFVEFGGHARAAGAAIKKEKFTIFIERFERYATDNFVPQEPQEHIDLALRPQDINWEFWDWLQRMAPYGEGNPLPHFMLENIEVVEMREVGKKADHLQLKLFARAGGRLIKAILFKAARLASVRLGTQLHCIVEIIADKWNGHRDLKLKIIDWRVMQEESATKEADEYAGHYVGTELEER